MKQSTPKAGGKYWADEFDELFVGEPENCFGIATHYVQEDDPEKIKDFIRTALQKAIAQERERIAEEIEVHFLERSIGDKHFDIRDEVINIITNNHE